MRGAGARDPRHRHAGPSAGCRWRDLTPVFPSRGSRRRDAIAHAPAGAPAAPPQAGTPAYLQQAYDLTYLSQTAGGGDTVAVVDAGDDPNAESDLAVFRSTYGLPACTSANGCLTKVNEQARPRRCRRQRSDWEEEESLDLDAVSALCPNCHILLVEADSSALARPRTAGHGGPDPRRRSDLQQLGTVDVTAGRHRILLDRA